jgi:hypothetical protein
LRDAAVRSVIVVGRRPVPIDDARLTNIVEADVSHLAPHASLLGQVDACFFCLGVSSLGLSEAEYARPTYDLTMAAARELVRVNSNITFEYVSGAGTDSSERGRSMWARVKGRTENGLLGLGFRRAYMFRPGAVIPLHGIRSRTGWYNALYTLIRPIAGPLSALAPSMVTTTDRLSRAMLAVARDGYPRSILETADINRIGGA